MDSPPVPRPERRPARPLLPRRWRRKADPFGHGVLPRRAVALPEEGRGGAGDRWAAVRALALLLAAAAMMAWLFTDLFR